MFPQKIGSLIVPTAEIYRKKLGNIKKLQNGEMLFFVCNRNCLTNELILCLPSDLTTYNVYSTNELGAHACLNTL